MINENLGISIATEDLVILINALNENKITRSFVKQVVLAELKKGKKISEIISQADSQLDLDKIIQKIIQENQDAVENFKKGKETALQFLVGQVMRETRGQADVALVAKTIKDSLK